MAKASPHRRPLVLGAGPAGLTAGYLLARPGRPATVLEAADAVGGLARTEVRDGYRFDLGGHRFFTKSAGGGARCGASCSATSCSCARRLSRIRWRGRFIDYPLAPATCCARWARPSSLAAAPPTRPRAAPARAARSQLRALGHQPLRPAPVRALLPLLHREGLGRSAHRDPRRVGGPAHPRAVALPSRRARALGDPATRGAKPDRGVPLSAFGPGQMWEAMAAQIAARAARCGSSSPVTGLAHRRGRARSRSRRGSETIDRGAVISSLPLRDAGRPGRPPRRLAGARRRRRASLPRFHHASRWCSTAPIRSPTTGSTSTSPSVRVGRIQNFRAWSPAMVPEPAHVPRHRVLLLRGRRALGAPDDDARRPGRRASSSALGLARATRSSRGHVVRVPKAYPIYDSGYARRLADPRAGSSDLGGPSAGRAATACIATTTPTTRC